MPKRIRVGFIGCGGISNGHAQRLKAVPEARISALMDVDANSLKTFQERNPETGDCPVFLDYQEMLDSVELDAVEIHSPHTAHFQQMMDALDRGLHVLVEKPMVCSVEHAKQILDKAEQVGTVVLVSYQRHYEPEFRYIRESIASGILGEVQFVSAFQCQDWYRSQQGKWRQDPALSGGGQLNDSGSHLIDIILWTTGLGASEVTGYIDNLGTAVDINSALSIKFGNRAQGSVSIVGNAPTFWEDLTFLGSEGAIFQRNGKLSHLPQNGKMFEPTQLPGGPANADANFINAILGREEVESPPECALRVIELTEAAWKSAETGHPVKVGP
jgi:predicted dehydrogenase